MFLVLLASLTPAQAFTASSFRTLAKSRFSSSTLAANLDASTTFFFPGQGAQSLGMASSLPTAPALFKQASEILNFDLLDAVTNGPKGE